MKLSTHLFIGHKVKDYLDEAYQTDTGINALCFGNVFADLSALPVLHPHYKARSLDYVYDEISRLCEYIPGSGNSFGDLYYFRLGIITHYITDFFCRAHQGVNKGNPKEHIQYEFGLRNHLEKHYKRLKFADVSGFRTAEDCAGIIKQLDTWLDEYQSAEPGFEHDIMMACKASCFVSASIAEICVESRRSVFEMFVTACCLAE